jgi:hypothetical protein
MTGSHELVWVTAVLDSLPEVDLLTIEARCNRRWIDEGSVSVPGVDLRIHAASWVDALLLVESLRLTEVEDTHAPRPAGEIAYCWRTWRGWCAEGSRETAVSVEITAGDEVHAVEDGAA